MTICTTSETPATGLIASPALKSARIVHFQRRPFPGQVSIEQLFDSLREPMREMGLAVVPRVVPYLSKGFWPRVASTLWARRRQGDVNHITGDIHFIALALKRDRTILTIHDCLALERLSGIKQWLMRKFWFELPIRQAAIVTVISEETKRELLRHVSVPIEKIVVIPDAAAPTFQPRPRPFRSDFPQILQIGTKRNKNLPRLIEAVEGLKCHLKIVGTLDDAQRGQLERSGVSFSSDANLSEAEMYQAYCDCDLVSFVSTYEGFGVPIVEAQWVERPVVTSNCSSMPEIAGQGACLIDPFDVQSIRNGLERVIEDAEYREQIVEHGRRNRERFSLAEVASRYASIYQRLASQSRLN